MSRDTEDVVFQKVLVANRGEIARRIFRTLRSMGLSTVAVFVDADSDAPHVREADEAVRLASSYLDGESLIRAARAVDAEAIHPGYGFLAENHRFAELCAEAGLVFIGPSPEAIRQMGNKAEAKAMAAAAGVPVLDGFSLDGLAGDDIRRRAEELGYPLLVKAAAGGGGKGMRVVASAADLDDALTSAAREAQSAFGDPALLIERWVASPRHVEVQVLADHHGKILHLFERDCSVQRRHQKVFEEAPSPAVDRELGERLGAAAVALARAVEYRGAGTVEFLLEPGGAFFFLEMNTRLQVEHPVTEAVTGQNLVRHQVDIAQGRPLGLEQSDLHLFGHAIEARLYAEDPENDFLPATGRLLLWHAPGMRPVELPGIRMDSGVEAGVEIGIDFDPLLAKVIGYGRDRGEALRRLHRGLSELAVGGLVTNREFLLAVLEHEAFRSGEVDTGFIERHLPPPARSRPVAPEVSELHAIAATLALFAERRQVPGPLPASLPSGWRSRHQTETLRDGQEQRFELDGRELTVRYLARPSDRFEVEVVPSDSETSGGPRRIAELIEPPSEGLMILEVDGIRRRFRVGLEAGSNDSRPRRLTVHGLGRISELTTVPRFPMSRASTLAGGCAAPMTGRVIEVSVAPGERVTAGDGLLVLESMKMEHRLEAPEDGVVEEVRVEVGQMVDPDEVLVIVAPVVAEESD